MSSSLSPAPGPLRLVQDFMNTWPIGGYRPDLLAARRTAEEWLASAGLPRGAARGLGGLRELRDEVRMLVASGRGAAAVARARLLPAAVEIGADGTVGVVPAGEGAERVASAVWLAIAVAQQPGRTPGEGRWERLKLCRNAECGSAFYDRSRNNSGVWHDVRTCGNVANLRAFRARRRLAADGLGGDEPERLGKG